MSVDESMQAGERKSLDILKKLRSRSGNQVCFDCKAQKPTWASIPFAIYICLDCASHHRNLGVHISFVRSTTLDANWEWKQLRKMKVGGNESAAKFFKSNGGSAALASKDPKVKYGSNAATKYKEEIQRRAEEDKKQYPGEVVVTGSDDTATPTPEKDEDFFSSWDKPAIKRPTPPPSRTATPPVVGRTSSPLNPQSNGNGIDRSKSPLGTAAEKPPVSRTTTSSALRTKSTGTGARKGSVLGAKKTQKLGAKKVGAGDAIDFDEAEKKAKEEAERIAKLGYDPDAEAEAEKKTTGKPKIVSPTPITPSSPKHTRNSSDVERLGLGMGRLGFGQVAGGQQAKAAPKKMGGFGSTGASAATEEEETYAREKFSAQKGISSDEFFGRNAYDPQAVSEARTRLQNFEGSQSISSNQYFGREEEEDVPVDMTDMNSIEGAAREFARRFAGTAGEDIENLTSALGQGASKLQDAMRQYLR